MDVSVVIPTMDEEATIGECIKKAKTVFKEMGLEGEVIVADNSHDRTPRIARKLGAKVVTPEKLGYGNAYLAGLREASGCYVVMVDGDGTYNLSEMPKLLKPLIQGKADLVIGNRFGGHIERGAMPWLHEKIGNPLLSWLVRKMYGADVSDSHCGMRAFTKEAYNKMRVKSVGMEFASEMVIKAVEVKLRILEVPVTYSPRVAPSKLNSFADGWRHLEFILVYNPAGLFMYTGLAIMILGIMLMTFVGLSINIGSFTPQIHSMIFGSMILVVGFQLISLGVFSDIYSEKFEFRSRNGISKFLIEQLSSEVGIFFGLVLFIFGAVTIIWIVYYWINTNFGELMYQRRAVVAATFVTLGIEMVCTYIFSKMLMMER